MDINSRIKWTLGTVLSADVMNALDNNRDLVQLATMRASVGQRFGLLPNIPFEADGFFVDGCLEIPALKCSALLPSGMIVNANEPVKMKIPKLKEGLYYCCVGYGMGSTEYESGNVVFTRPVYDYSVMSSEEMTADDVMPFLRLNVHDGSCFIDKDYILPSMLLSGDRRFMEYRDRIVESLETIVSHPKLAEGAGKFNISRYLFHFKNFTPRNTTDDFLQTANELAIAVQYFIVAPEAKDGDVELADYCVFDPGLWLDWLEDFLKRAVSVLDGLVLEDDGLDIDALKESIKKELYNRLVAELSTEIIYDIRPMLNDDMGKKLAVLLKDYVDGTFRTETRDTLMSELGEELKNKLYTDLYEALYDALNVQKEEEQEVFMPLI